MYLDLSLLQFHSPDTKPLLSNAQKYNRASKDIAFVGDGQKKSWAVQKLNETLQVACCANGIGNPSDEQ